MEKPATKTLTTNPTHCSHSQSHLKHHSIIPIQIPLIAQFLTLISSITPSYQYKSPSLHNFSLSSQASLHRTNTNPPHCTISHSHLKHHSIIPIQIPLIAQFLNLISSITPSYQYKSPSLHNFSLSSQASLHHTNTNPPHCTISHSHLKHHSIIPIQIPLIAQFLTLISSITLSYQYKSS